MNLLNNIQNILDKAKNPVIHSYYDPVLKLCKKLDIEVGKAKKEEKIFCFVPRGTTVKGYLHPQNLVQREIEQRESGTDDLILAVCVEEFNKLLRFKSHAMKPYVPLSLFNDFFRTFLYGFEFNGDKSNDKTFVKIKEGVFRKKCYTRCIQAALQSRGTVSEESAILKNFTKELYDFVDRQCSFLNLFYTSDRILHYQFLFRNYTLKDGNNKESSNEKKISRNKSEKKTMLPYSFVTQRKKKLDEFRKNFKAEKTLGDYMNQVMEILKDNRKISVGTILHWLDDDQKKSLYDKLGIIIENSQKNIDLAEEENDEESPITYIKLLSKSVKWGDADDASDYESESD